MKNIKNVGLWIQESQGAAASSIFNDEFRKFMLFAINSSSAAGNYTCQAMLSKREATLLLPPLILQQTSNGNTYYEVEYRV